MCFGGGSDASDAAERQERQRQAQIRQATAAIDRAFEGREAQRGDFVGALRSELLDQAERQKRIADRNLRFSLARGGLTGGSAAADSAALLGEEFQQGILQGERQAQASLADLVAADEQTRQNLIALAQGGAGTSTAAQNAASALRSNLEGAQSRGLTQGLGDIFSRTRDLFTRQQEAAARRRGLRESEVFADPFSR